MRMLSTSFHPNSHDKVFDKIVSKIDFLREYTSKKNILTKEEEEKFMLYKKFSKISI